MRIVEKSVVGGLVNAISESRDFGAMMVAYFGWQLCLVLADSFS